MRGPGDCGESWKVECGGVLGGEGSEEIAHGGSEERVLTALLLTGVGVLQTDRMLHIAQTRAEGETPLLILQTVHFHPLNRQTPTNKCW